MLIQNFGGTSKEYYGIFDSGSLSVDFAKNFLVEDVRSCDSMECFKRSLGKRKLNLG